MQAFVCQHVGLGFTKNEHNSSPDGATQSETCLVITQRYAMLSQSQDVWLRREVTRNVIISGKL